MIYTSYFAICNRASDTTSLISIARSAIIGFRGVHFKALAPSTTLLTGYKQGLIDVPAYTVQYKEMLSKLDPKQVLQELKAIAYSNKDIWLCCWEKPSSFCHRHLVADWLNEACPELNIREWSTVE